METLQQFIFRRHAEIDALEKPLRDQLAFLGKEREQLRRAAVAAGFDVNDAVEVHREPALALRAPKRASEATIKNAIIQVLRSTGRPMTALEILPLINETLGVDYPRSSLSPQLSRLKADGKIKRDGNLWSEELPFLDMPMRPQVDGQKEAQPVEGAHPEWLKG